MEERGYIILIRSLPAPLSSPATDIPDHRAGLGVYDNFTSFLWVKIKSTLDVCSMFEIKIRERISTTININ